MGVAQIADPEQVAWELDALRSSLMTHPRYKSIPSMQPEAKKTAISFHAKIDLDDKHNKAYGEWYNDLNPLTLEKLRGARYK